MKRLTELKNAFLYVPKLMRLVYKTDKKYLFYVIGETLSFAIIGYPTVFLSKYALDAMDTKQPFDRYVAICLLLLLLQLSVNMIKTFFNSRRPGRTKLVQGRLYNAFHKKCMELDYELLAEKDVQELQTFAGEFIGSMMLSNTVWKFVSLFSSLIAFVAACAFLTAINFWLILAAGLSLVFDSAIMALMIPKRFVLDKKISIFSRRIDYYHGLAIDQNPAKDLRIFDMTPYVVEKAGSWTLERIKQEHKKNRLDLIQSVFNIITSEGTNWIIYIVLGWFALNGEISVGSLSQAVGNLALFRRYFGSITNTLVGYTETAKHIEYYNRFMNLESKFKKTGLLPLKIKKEDSFMIEFRNVAFRYPGRTDYVLKGFNLVVNSREKLAVVGENGAGKSTFVKLLMRLYDPSEGEILLNGINIKQYDYDMYLSSFAPVFQDYKLFAFTVGENISSFDEADFNQITAAAQKAGIDARIQELPNQYKTYITKQFDETGVNFSGGEQQKLAIARTYFKKQAIITILDEPTSALDPRAEHLLYRQFNDLIGDNTAFFISHRLSSAMFCDKIILIKDKKVVEYGTHSELMAKKGDYYSLYSMQASYYDT